MTNKLGSPLRDAHNTGYNRAIEDCIKEIDKYIFPIKIHQNYWHSDKEIFKRILKVLNELKAKLQAMQEKK